MFSVFYFLLFRLSILCAFPIYFVGIQNFFLSSLLETLYCSSCVPFVGVLGGH